MFGLFKTKAPLSPWEKAWTENRMTWMASHFGMQHLLDAPTLVSDYAGIPEATSEVEATALLQFLGQWMRLDSKAHLQIFSDSETVAAIGAASDTDSVRVGIHEKHFHNRDEMIAIIARQLAQAALTGTVVANEAWAIDLFPAFCGLGFFAANANVRGTANSAGLSWWTTQQQAYLPARIFGYALALRAIARDETSNEWSSQLRQDALVTFDEGLNYIRKTGDTVFSRDLLTKPREDISVAALCDELRTGSPSRKISAMWAVNKRDELNLSDSTKLGELVTGCLRHKEPEVRAVAAASLPRYDRSANAAMDIADALKDRNEKVRIAAAEAMQAFVGVEQETMIEDLTEALKDDVRLVVFNAARSLTAYGNAAEPAVKTLLKRLRRTLNECRNDDSRTLLLAIDAIVEDAPTRLQEFFGESDAEYLSFSNELLTEIREAAQSTK